MYCLDIQAELKKPLNNTLDTARLLRSIGAIGRHTGYNYLIYIVDLVRADPDNNCFLTKCVYPQTAKHFNVKPASVEHAIRTLISSCWNRDDHTALDYVAGTHLERIPTNGQFIDILVAFLDYINAGLDTMIVIRLKRTENSMLGQADDQPVAICHTYNGIGQTDMFRVCGAGQRVRDDMSENTDAVKRFWQKSQAMIHIRG